MSDGFEEFLGGYKSPRVSVRITQRADLLAEHAELQRAHQSASRDDLNLNRVAEAPAVMRQISDLEDQIAASEFPFTFEAISRHQYLRLITRHKPRKEDRDAGLDFNGDTFPVALIAACSVEPAMTEEQARVLLDTLSDKQFGKLWNAAVAVNAGDDAAPKSVTRFAMAARNGSSSTTASPEESLEASSSDE